MRKSSPHRAIAGRALAACALAGLVLGAPSGPARAEAVPIAGEGPTAPAPSLDAAMAERTVKERLKHWTVKRICTAIANAAEAHALPVHTFARLIWIESRFDIRALSPAGAQGIAQFMPATARMVGLADPWDPQQAIPASAAHLAELRAAFGNFGLAAAGYNAGAGRVDAWLKGARGLPFETRDYVAAITGQAAATFRRASVEVNDFPLLKGKDFAAGCNALPIRKTRWRGTIAARGAGGPFQPWGVQVAGHFRQSVALRSWERVRGRLGVALGDARPALYRQRGPRGLKRKWAVRLGAETRKEAIAMCRRIRQVGGFCLVKKNRS